MVYTCKICGKTGDWSLSSSEHQPPRPDENATLTVPETVFMRETSVVTAPERIRLNDHAPAWEVA